MHFSQPLFIFLLCAVHHLSYPARAEFAPGGAEDPASRDGAYGAEAFKLLCTELLKRSSFLFFPAEEKKRSKEKKAPAGQNLPVLRALFCSAVNAFAVRADTYSRTYILAYHLRLRDAKERPPPGEPTGARHRQILHSRVYLPMLCF